VARQSWGRCRDGLMWSQTFAMEDFMTRSFFLIAASALLLSKVGGAMALPKVGQGTAACLLVSGTRGWRGRPAQSCQARARPRP
jgi:hypothetical protein